MNPSPLIVDRRWSHAHPAGENPCPVKPKICFVHRDEFSDAEVGLVTLKRFSDKDIYRRLLGILSGFPPKKTLSWNLDKRERLFCSFISFLQQQCQRRAWPKRANCKCTTAEVGGQHVLHLKKWTQWKVICKNKKTRRSLLYLSSCPHHASGTFL